MTLNQNETNRSVRVVEIAGSRQVQRQLAQLGIHVGDIILVKRNAPLGGPLLIERNGVEVAIGRRIAECITVEDVS